MNVRLQTARPKRGPRARFLQAEVVERAVSVGSPLLLLLLWEGFGRAGALDQRFFPTPSAIASTFVQLMKSGELIRDVGTSMGRIAIGFVLGAVPGLLLGTVMGLSRIVRAALKPMVGALYPIPKTAVFPLLLLIFGIGEPSKYAIVAIGVFFLVLLNTMAGVLSIEPVYLDVAKNFGAGRRELFPTIAFPGALPLIFTGLRLAWGNALILIVVAEIIGARSGIGAFIWNAWQTFQVERMYVGLVVISIIGFLSFLVIDELQRWLIPWKGGRGT
jgi:NitT/TauT family transport system permease protein